MKPPFRGRIRLAKEEDSPVLEELIRASVMELQADVYSVAQRRAALGPVFGVDRVLIRDGTYFVAEADISQEVVGCGGWSMRQAVYGGDRDRTGQNAFIDASREPARIRAFFVKPGWERRGIGRAILARCEEALVSAGFREAVMVATLAGEPLYTACGYSVLERLELPIGEGALSLPGVRMGKRF